MLSPQNYTQKPYNYQIFAGFIIGFLLGIGLSAVFLTDQEIIFWLILALAAIGLLFFDDRWTRAASFITGEFFLGLAYPSVLNQEKLIILPDNFLLAALESIRQTANRG